MLELKELPIVKIEIPKVTRNTDILKYCDAIFKSPNKNLLLKISKYPY